jgi:glutathione synthase
LTPEEEKMISAIGPWLVKQDIHFAGLDVIDGKLTEINITCPTGLQHINKLEGKNLEKEVVDYFSEVKS